MKKHSVQYRIVKLRKQMCNVQITINKGHYNPRDTFKLSQ